MMIEAFNKSVQNSFICKVVIVVEFLDCWRNGEGKKNISASNVWSKQSIFFYHISFRHIRNFKIKGIAYVSWFKCFKKIYIIYQHNAALKLELNVVRNIILDAKY